MSDRGFIFERLGIHGPVYWRGRMDAGGIPLTTIRREDAYSFTSYWSAMQCGETHDALRNSPDWRVVPR
jgi:hypothetical protein